MELFTPVLRDGKEIGGTQFNYTKNGKLTYNFYFKSLPSNVYLNNKLNYSMAQIQLDFERSDLSRTEIFSGYHSTTGLFAFLSLVSFFINPDVVPGM